MQSTFSQGLKFCLSSEVFFVMLVILFLVMVGKKGKAWTEFRDKIKQCY